MKLNKLILVSLFLLAILCLGAVSAQEVTSQTDVGQNQDDLIPVPEVSEDTTIEDTQIASINDNDKLTASDEDTVGIAEEKEVSAVETLDVISDNGTSGNESDSITVDVTNVYKGENNTITVTVPEATGTVEITVGNITYTPSFVDGVATQTISQYDDGLNTVTVKYNDIIKETVFKALDGVVTNETFSDYFEIVGKYYELMSFIPEGATLDFRGVVHVEYSCDNALRININKPINIISSTKDGVIDYMGNLWVLATADGCNFSNIESVGGITVFSYNFALSNSFVSYFSGNDYCKVSNSTFDSSFDLGSNSVISNCTINSQWGTGIHKFDNVTVTDSTFNQGILIRANQAAIPNVDFIISNCIINGDLTLTNVGDTLIEKNVIFGSITIKGKNIHIKNNTVRAYSSNYAVSIASTSDKDNVIVDNVLYSKNYCGNNAVSLNNWAVNTIENNTPTQIDLGINMTVDTIFYDENTTVTVNMSGVEGNVTFYLNNQPISVVELSNGIATQIIDGMYNVGSNDISAVYEDKINDLYAINRISLTVNKVDCIVGLVYDNATEGKTTTVDVVLPSDANGTIIFTITNGDYTITINQVANGSQNIIKIPALFEGNYTISAVFNSIKYVVNSSSGIISFVHVPVYKLSAKAISMDYYDGTKYKVLVTKDGKAVGAGEIVKITFNGKTTSVKTDKNGYATLALNAAPKTYTIKAVYQGKTISTKVVIKNVLKANNLAKKKATTIKYTATLKNSKGKAIAGKVVKFKIKGKTYSVKTNSKGVATVALKNLAVGKYYIVSSYGACTVKKLITIKK